ncbi:hypothetical protein G7059_03695 [Erysipelothrix sp. HDW6A]|uniref:hypothetical protein n=1 Tax=Erysipelothrix sp. HDW6A TaxID=2714928 RepID=UPI00140DC17A|nr:hypothetical protein [Erysipelothrix sp. HDW6A]QIK57015.1 hypothetical protein G7059_03695 [Erysipelothrix sp. HDW6A]
MFDWVGESLEKMWRSMSWGMMSWILDTVNGFVNEIIVPISKMTFVKSPYIANVISEFSKAAALLLVPFTMFAIISAVFAGELTERLKKIMIGCILSLLIIVGTRPIVLWLSDSATEISTALVGENGYTSLDDSITVSFLKAANTDMSEDKVKSFVADYQLPSFDYNDVDESGDFKYTLNIFPTMVFGIIMLFLLTYIAIQMLFRSFNLAFMFVMTPFSSLTLVTQDSSGWRFARSQLTSSLMLNACQLWSLVFALEFINSQQTSNAFLKILILIVGLLAVLMIPNMINGIVGGTQQSILQAAQGALMGANAARALTAGAIGSVASTAMGFGNMLKGFGTGQGKGLGGLVGGAASAPLRFASGAIRGDGKTIFGREGSKANQRGANIRSGVDARRNQPENVAKRAMNQALRRGPVSPGNQSINPEPHVSSVNPGNEGSSTFDGSDLRDRDTSSHVPPTSNESGPSTTASSAQNVSQGTGSSSVMDGNSLKEHESSSSSSQELETSSYARGSESSSGVLKGESLASNQTSQQTKLGSSQKTQETRSTKPSVDVNTLNKRNQGSGQGPSVTKGSTKQTQLKSTNRVSNSSRFKTKYRANNTEKKG